MFLARALQGDRGTAAAGGSQEAAPPTHPPALSRDPTPEVGPHEVQSQSKVGVRLVPQASDPPDELRHIALQHSVHPAPGSPMPATCLSGVSAARRLLSRDFRLERSRRRRKWRLSYLRESRPPPAGLGGDVDWLVTASGLAGCSASMCGEHVCSFCLYVGKLVSLGFLALFLMTIVFNKGLWISFGSCFAF